MLRKIGLAAVAAAVAMTAAPAAAQSVAPGQSKADYHAWLAQSPENREAVLAFRTFLAERELADVVPTWQLVRTSSAWKQCNAGRFEVAPVDQWSNIVQTLRFVKEEVRPAIGDVEALSVFRNEKLNGCSRGARQSAHRMFFAMDLVPASDISRSELIRSLCAAHARSGRAFNAGLGFYSASRFHVDTSGYRKWGTDGRGASSPCNGRTA
ncbi:MAG: hypothetical protein ACK4K7_09850 [Allosphingosinicella sp.]|uniref:D-Ala-D-Ala carboxypeptidase family metallohydrolase n=1 Tax=Allosphingosinicella sp. TaxID=2823234 RepID=UPI003942DC09